MKTTFGLIGYPLTHSFSKKYFTQKFQQAGCDDYEYLNFELEDIASFPDLLEKHPSLAGLNVTIPYKRQILKFTDEQSEVVQEIGAANTLTLTSGGKIVADNTDVTGFERSIKPYLKPRHKRALILGTGGAAAAVAYVFDQLQIEYLFVSRSPQNSRQISYADLTEALLKNHLIVVNTTPVGTYPGIHESLPFPYNFVTDLHLFYDLIYNPAKTRFLQEAEKRGAFVLNGLRMLELQAEASFEIWRKKSGLKFKKNC